MAAEAIGPLDVLETPPEAPLEALAEVPHWPMELLVLAFTDARLAGDALLLLGQLGQSRAGSRSLLGHAAVLTKDVFGRGSFVEAGDFVRRVRALPVRVRRVLIRLLPGPLSVLTGGSARFTPEVIPAADPMLTSGDYARLARYLSVDSSVLLLLVERHLATEVADMIGHVAVAVQAARLQITLDNSVEHFMAGPD